MKSEKQKMLAGELYDASDAELQDDLAATREWLVRYNAALGMATADRRVLLAERLGSVGDGSTIRPPFHCDYGFNIHLGAGAFLNFGCVILDVVEVLWILDPANRHIVDANAASAALLFQHLLMPADRLNQFQHVGASSNSCGRQYGQRLLVNRTEGCCRQEPVPLPIRGLDLQRVEEHTSATVRRAFDLERCWFDRQGRDCRGRKACEPAKSFE